MFEIHQGDLLNNSMYGRFHTERHSWYLLSSYGIPPHIEEPQDRDVWFTVLDVILEW